jgi:hypothetical protein
MGSILRREPDGRWTGTLGGYQVEVFTTLGHLALWIGHPTGCTFICRSVASPRDGAAIAREYVEQHGPPWYPPTG